MFMLLIKMVNSNSHCNENKNLIEFSLGITVLHHAVDSKNLDTIAVIIKHLDADADPATKNAEINREVGMHKWTPLYRAGYFR